MSGALALCVFSVGDSSRPDITWWQLRDWQSWSCKWLKPLDLRRAGNHRFVAALSPFERKGKKPGMQGPEGVFDFWGPEGA